MRVHRSGGRRSTAVVLGVAASVRRRGRERLPVKAVFVSRSFLPQVVPVADLRSCMRHENVVLLLHFPHQHRIRFAERMPEPLLVLPLPEELFPVPPLAVAVVVATSSVVVASEETEVVAIIFSVEVATVEVATVRSVGEVELATIASVEEVAVTVVEAVEKKFRGPRSVSRFVMTLELAAVKSVVEVVVAVVVPVLIPKKSRTPCMMSGIIPVSLVLVAVAVVVVARVVVAVIAASVWSAVISKLNWFIK